MNTLRKSSPLFLVVCVCLWVGCMGSLVTGLTGCGSLSKPATEERIARALDATTNSITAARPIVVTLAGPAYGGLAETCLGLVVTALGFVSAKLHSASARQIGAARAPPGAATPPQGA